VPAIRGGLLIDAALALLELPESTRARTGWQWMNCRPVPVFNQHVAPIFDRAH